MWLSFGDTIVLSEGKLRAKFLQVAAKWQEAHMHWQDRDTLSFTLMVVACEALKPHGTDFKDHTIYEVIEALLGKILRRVSRKIGSAPTIFEASICT